MPQSSITLSDDCDLGDLKNRSVTNFLIAGLTKENNHIKERLLSEDDSLELSKAISIAETLEKSIQQAAELNESSTSKENNNKCNQ